MSNLLEKASIITTPTAYSSGFIHSVKPEENLGSELITNGDYSNGSTGWILGSQWQIINNQAVYNGDGSNNQLTQDISIVQGKTYRVQFNVISIAGRGKVQMQTTTAKTFTTIGFKTFDIKIVNSPKSFVSFARSSGNVNMTIDNVSVKEIIGADFTFTRNSPATRVNSQGLVESVQILGSNVVTNGDFSQIGSELITNGDFATNTDWTLVGSATISNGRGNFVSVSDKIYQEPTLSQEKIYKITFDVVNYTTGNLRVFLGSTGDAFLEVSSNGSYIAYLKSIGGIDRVQFRSSGGVFVGAITNVSVVEIIDWTAGDGWSFGGNKASCDGTQTDVTNLIQTISTNIQNQLVKISFTLDISAGTLSGSLFNSGGAEFDALTTSGNYSVEATSTDVNPTILFQGDSNFVGSISNVVIEPTTDDTDLPRINYENGSGSWLLEPQRTNLITYSEDYTDSSWNHNGTLIITPNYTTSPDGTQNATRLNKIGSGNRLGKSINLEAGKTYDFSFYMKNNGGTSALNISIDGQGLPLQSYTISNDFERYSFNFTASTTATSEIRVFTSAVDIDLFLWGVQFEESSYATSYIPTSGSPQTRSQDLAENAGNSDLISSTEGVLYVEIAALANDNTRKAISINNGGLTDYLFFRYIPTSGSSNNRFQIIFRSGGNNIVNQMFDLANNLDFNKIAFSYKLNEFKTFVNGVQIGPTVTSGIVFNQTINSLDFDEFNGTNNFFGKAKCVAVFKEALTDAELICLTTI